MRNTLLSFAFLGWMLACQGGSPGVTTSAPPEQMMDRSGMDKQAYSAEGDASGGIGQQIIRQGSISFTVRDAQAARRAVDGIMTRYDAVLHSEYLANTDYETRYTLQLRVPAGSLDSLVTDLEADIGAVEHKSIQAQDVTAEYIDLETRMTNKRAYLEQYRQLLKETKSIDEALRVREQIRQLEEEMESVTGRLKYLSEQVAMSMLEISLMQRKPYVFRPDNSISFVERMKESISGGWYAFVQFCLGLVRLWPFLIILSILAWWYRRWKARLRRKVPPPPGA